VKSLCFNTAAVSCFCQFVMGTVLTVDGKSTAE